MGKKYVYLFSEGNADMRELLGGKGANLAEMSNIGLPVPQGFTITTEACIRYYDDGERIAPEIMEEIMLYKDKLEEMTGKKLGDSENPLLVSVRSGARASMPGMMDTILNLGINETVVETLSQKSGNPRWAWDCYRRFIQMYSDVVMGVGKEYFEVLIANMKEAKGVELDTLALPVIDLEQSHQLLHIVGRQFAVQLDALGLFHRVDILFKAALGQLHHHVGEHLDKAAVGVIDEAGIARQLHHGLGHLVIHAQIQDGVHHTGHGGPGTGADGDQQRILAVAQLLAGHLLQLILVEQDLVHDLRRDLLAVVIVADAGFGSNGKALRNGQTNVAHLG